MQTFYSTDVGKIREHNEDNVIILNNDNGEYLLAVADGMGGHKAGEVASAIVINHLTEEFYGLDSIGDKESAIEFLRNIVTEMNQKIFEYTKENPDSKGMGTTFVCAIKTDDYLLYGNIGDSSGYVIKKTNRRVTFEYILLDGINDMDECAIELASLLKGMNCYVNLIPYNETENISFKRTKSNQIIKFYDILKKKNINVTIRKEFGSKVDAACGQLRAKKKGEL